MAQQTVKTIRSALRITVSYFVSRQPTSRLCGGRWSVRTSRWLAALSLAAQDMATDNIQQCQSDQALSEDNRGCPCRLLNRDFPDDLWPTTTVGLSDGFIADRSIRKRLFCWMEGESGRFRIMMSLRPTLAEAFTANPHRHSPPPPRPPAVSSVAGVIGAPPQVGAAVESAPESLGTAAWLRRPRPSGR